MKLKILQISFIYLRKHTRAQAHVQGWGGAEGEGGGERIPN